MARHYSPKTFLRQVSGNLLARYLETRQVKLQLDLDAYNRQQVDSAFDELAGTAPEVWRRIEADFAAVSEIASTAGTAALLREARNFGLDWSPGFKSARNAHDRAFWAYMEDPEVFEAAANFHAMDSFSAGRWHRRAVGANLVPATDSEGIAALEEQLRRTFAQEGRGRFCHIDYYSRNEPLRHCYFAYPEDFASSDLGYGDDGQLRRRARKCAFEVIFVYRPEEGVLELLAPGGDDCCQELAADFCITILDLPELPPESTEPAFDLSILKDGKFTFPTDSADHIAAVYVRELRLDRPGRCRQRITLSALPTPFKPDAVYQLMRDAITRTTPLLWVSLRVARAKLRFVFERQDGCRGRAKTLNFELIAPDGCSLKDDPYDQIARKYLERWGIAQDRAADHTAGASGVSGVGGLRGRVRT